MSHDDWIIFLKFLAMTALMIALFLIPFIAMTTGFFVIWFLLFVL